MFKYHITTPFTARAKSQYIPALLPNRKEVDSHKPSSKMFVSAVETAPQTSSNPLFAFIFCNLIILIILLGSKSSSSDSETQDALPGLHGYSNTKPAEIVDVERRPDQIERTSRPEKKAEEKQAFVQVSEVCNSEINGKEEQKDNNCEYENQHADGEYDYEAENMDNGEEDNGDDDELRRRIEDFITKVNREWKEEHLKDRKPKLTLLDQPLALITKKNETT